MEKQVAQWSYWLGLVCLVIALILRALAVANVTIVPDHIVTAQSFYKGAILFLVTTVATANFAWQKSQKS